MGTRGIYEQNVLLCRKLVSYRIFYIFSVTYLFYQPHIINFVKINVVFTENMYTLQTRNTFLISANIKKC